MDVATTTSGHTPAQSSAGAELKVEKLIDELNDLATRPEHRWSQQWSPGDTLFWDNRCILHRGTGYDADLYRRNMRQSRVRGAGPTLEE